MIIRSLFSLAIGLLTLNAYGQACKKYTKLQAEIANAIPDNVLANFLDQGTGTVDTDGWVFCHPNGNDYVLAPFRWGENPNRARQAFINLVFETITESRNALSSLGSLQRNFIIMLDESGNIGLGSAFWPIGGVCAIRLSIQRFRSLSREDRKFHFAHEIGHCFLMDNIAGHSSNSPGYERWWDESGAEYLASIIYPTFNTEHQKTFELDAPFPQPYDSYVLFHYYALQSSRPALLDFIQALYDHPGRSNRLAYLRSTNFGSIFHNFNYNFLFSEIPDDGGGAIPSRSSVTPLPYTLDPTLTTFPIDEIYPEQANVFEFFVPAGFNAVFSPIQNSQVEISLLHKDQEIYPWRSEFSVTGDCEQEQKVVLLLTHLLDDPITDMQMNYRLTPRTDCCNGVGGFTGTFDPCLIGRWRVDYSRASASFPGAADASGDLFVELKQDPVGQFSAEFNIRLQHNEDDYDIHRGTASGCLVSYTPDSAPQNTTFLKIMGVSLGPENVHTECCTSKGESTDITSEVAQWFTHLVFGYYQCDERTIQGLNGIRLEKVD